MDTTPLENKATKELKATKEAEAPAEKLNDCGHPGPGYVAASGTETVVHCAACSGRES